MCGRTDAGADPEPPGGAHGDFDQGRAGGDAGQFPYLRLIDSCITQLKAQGPSRTCNESKEEEKKNSRASYPKHLSLSLSLSLSRARARALSLPFFLARSLSLSFSLALSHFLSPPLAL